ncbi:mannose-6-phosphate isomerase, class I [Salinivibrio proteolyticus]|uniref:mannose-6-phosphate isomerase n=1 Tax=Salinivibrio proteolyticus TaxID=334715 RepID=A0ABY7LCI2_9GAMM|nr:mannose-6-phosphate isomerase, class I [Salinivibrio proteolyticus]WBA13942.1 mannose-6-phosphate isomerase, class I [Salinivibrio proteolyticus]
MNNLFCSQPFYLMRNPIQTYQWGSQTALTALFGIPNPTQQPQAEVWMGAHPKASSEIKVGDAWQSLHDTISAFPQAALSEATFAQFGELPFLFKVLAAETALSIQVHPSKQEAELGFHKENQQGIPLSAAHRNYKDANHKPELIYALTSFEAMNGFRDYPVIIDHIQTINNDTLNALFKSFIDAPTATSLEHAFGQLLALKQKEKMAALDALMTTATENETVAPFSTIARLAKQYPGDIGLFAPLLLNVVTLNPGEAMFLHARTPHAYIHGVGLEVMANSDNVLRAGLTPKHIDVNELVACTSFSPIAETQIKLTAQPTEQGEYYPVTVPDFNIVRYSQAQHVQCNMQSAEILFAVNAPLTVVHGDHELTIQKGESIFIPACTQVYTLHCDGDAVRVSNTTSA